MIYTLRKLPIVLIGLILYACSEQTKTNTSNNESEVVTFDPLPSWNDGANKEAILNFVGQSTDESHPGFIEPALRIATFDNDGTLWSEQPIYFQLFFVLYFYMWSIAVIERTFE